MFRSIKIAVIICLLFINGCAVYPAYGGYGYGGYGYGVAAPMYGGYGGYGYGGGWGRGGHYGGYRHH